MKSKQGAIGLLGAIIAITVVGFLVLGILGAPIDEVFGAVKNTILGEDEDLVVPITTDPITSGNPPILHLKIDTNDDPTEVHEFHLTGDRGHENFDSDDFFPDHCNVYATNEGGGTDKHAVWSINPGGRITYIPGGITQTYHGLNGFIDEVKELSRTSETASAFPDADSEAIGGENFEIFPSKEPNNRCGDSKCNLLIKHPENGGDYWYLPKHGLLCDNEKRWRVCGQVNQGTEIEAGGKAYLCKQEAIGLRGLSLIYYTWKTGQPPTLNFDSVLFHEAKPVGEIVTLRFEALDGDGDLKKIFFNIDDQGSKVGKCEFTTQYPGISTDGRIIRSLCSESERNRCYRVWDIKCTQPGTYKFQAQAEDEEGQNDASTIIEIRYVQNILHIKLDIDDDPTEVWSL